MNNKSNKFETKKINEKKVLNTNNIQSSKRCDLNVMLL